MSAPAFTSALHERLADRGLAVGDQHLAELRVAGHLAQHPVVGHVFALLRSGNPISTACAGAVEPRADAAPRVGRARRTSPCRCTITVGPASRLHQAQPPRQALAEEQVVAVVQHGLAEQLALAALRAPLQPRRQAAVAGLARRVLHRAAVLAHLQFEAAFGGGRRHAERNAAARPRRQVHLPRAQHRVLALGACISGMVMRRRLPRITAPVHRQRS